MTLPTAPHGECDKPVQYRSYRSTRALLSIGLSTHKKPTETPKAEGEPKASSTN